MCRRSHRQNVGSCRLEEEKTEIGAKSRCLVGVLAFVCYLNSLKCGLVFDDQPAIRDNMDLRPQTSLVNLLYNDFWGTPMYKEESHKSYRPLTVLTFRLNYLLHEAKPFGYHLGNVFLHTIVSLLYHRLCCHFLPSTASLVSAVLFSVHPIHTEAVTGVVGRAELLSSIFFLRSLMTYLHFSKNFNSNNYKAILRCLLFAGFAMFSKEQGITVIAACVAYDILLIMQPSRRRERVPRGPIKGPTPTWRKDLILRLLVMALGSVVLLAIRMKVNGTKLPVFNRFDNPAASENFPVRHLTQNYVVSLNAWLLLFPKDLCCDWSMGTVRLVHSLLELRVLFTVLFYTVILIFVRKLYIERSRALGMALSLCIFPFIPASNLLYPVGFVIAERVLYMPSMGFCMLIGMGWHALCSIHRKYIFLLNICLVILVCLNVAKTLKRNSDWETEETLFKSGLKVTRVNAKLYNNLGHVKETQGQHQEALDLFLKAASVQADDIGSHINVGRMYNLMGMIEKAESSFWIAKNLLPKKRPGESYQTHVAPRHMDLFLDLGNLLSRKESRLEEAQELYREAISMKVDYIDAYINRASVLLKLNRSEEAHRMYMEALKHDSMNADIFYNMGVLLLEQGKSRQALARFDDALRINPQHEKSLLNYAILTQDSGDSSLRKLAHERLQGLLNKGQQPERTYFNLGMLAMQEEDADGAEYYFKKSLQIRGDFDSALFNLALVLHKSGRALEALPHLLKLQGRHTKGLALLANIYFNHLRNFSAAKECYQQVLKQEPNNAVVLHNLCATYFHMGYLEDAESCLKRAKLLAPLEDFIDQHLFLVQKELKRTKEQNKTCNGSSVNCRSSLNVLRNNRSDKKR